MQKKTSDVQELIVLLGEMGINRDQTHRVLVLDIRNKITQEEAFLLYKNGWRICAAIQTSIGMQYICEVPIQQSESVECPAVLQ